MIRAFKTYSLPYAPVPVVKFSGYPATIPGIDDFYVSSANLAIMETTNSVFNTSLYDRIVPSTLPYWVCSSSSWSCS